MKQTKTMLRLELEVKPEMAANCQMAAMAPMTAMATGRRSILLTSRQMSAAAVLDTLTMLKSAQETLLTTLEQACGAVIRSAKNMRAATKMQKPSCKPSRQSCLRVCANAAYACGSLHGIWYGEISSMKRNRRKKWRM